MVSILIHTLCLIPFASSTVLSWTPVQAFCSLLCEEKFYVLDCSVIPAPNSHFQSACSAFCPPRRRGYREQTPPSGPPPRARSPGQTGSPTPGLLAGALHAADRGQGRQPENAKGAVTRQQLSRFEPQKSRTCFCPPLFPPHALHIQQPFNE